MKTILITGFPAVGKSTLLEALQSDCDADWRILDLDKFGSASPRSGRFVVHLTRLDTELKRLQKTISQDSLVLAFGVSSNLVPVQRRFDSVVALDGDFKQLENNVIRKEGRLPEWFTKQSYLDYQRDLDKDKLIGVVDMRYVRSSYAQGEIPSRELKFVTRMNLNTLVRIIKRHHGLRLTQVEATCTDFDE